MDNTYIGRKIDERYDIISLIGVGGMSNVYKAIDSISGNTVAIKFLKREFFDNEELIRRFKNESKAISLLDNPTIIKVLDVNMTAQDKYIVIEYIDGITLKDYINNRKILSRQETLHFTEVILKAISHAHNNGIIHRDLKPENIMLLRDGSLKIMDFGIARLSTSGQKTITDKAIGSVHYISPEQVRGKNSDARSDIYSIGIMMYEMVTGRLPFLSDSAVSVAMKQISDIPTKPSEFVASIPIGLEQIILKAIEKNADDRYQSADDMLIELYKFKENPSVLFTDRTNTEPTQVINMHNKKETTKKPMKNPRNNKKFKFTLPGMIKFTAAFTFCSIITIFLVFKLSGSPLLTSYEDIELPNFVGTTESELKSSGYNLKYDIEYVHSSTQEEGKIISQSPKPPKTVKENSTIKVKVSKGPENKIMPNLINFSRFDAQKILSEMNVNVSISTIPHDSVKRGHIIKTIPEQSEIITSDETVTIYISRGNDNDKNKTHVPNLVGLTSLEEAKKVLAKNSLRLGLYTSHNDSTPAGTILEQNPTVGTELIMGGAVDLVISSGPIVCSYCGSTGHEEIDCENKKRDEHKCDLCGEKGHYEDSCPMKTHLCSICNEKGHYEHICPNKCSICKGEHITSNHSCSSCGKKGHTDETDSRCDNYINPEESETTDKSPTEEVEPSVPETLS